VGLDIQSKPSGVAPSAAPDSANMHGSPAMLNANVFGPSSHAHDAELAGATESVRTDVRGLDTDPTRSELRAAARSAVKQAERTGIGHLDEMVGQIEHSEGSVAARLLFANETLQAAHELGSEEAAEWALTQSQELLSGDYPELNAALAGFADSVDPMALILSSLTSGEPEDVLDFLDSIQKLFRGGVEAVSTQNDSNSELRSQLSDIIAEGNVTMAQLREIIRVALRGLRASTSAAEARDGAPLEGPKLNAVGLANGEAEAHAREEPVISAA